MIQRDWRMIKIARIMTANSGHPRRKHAAILTDTSGNIISSGCNHYGVWLGGELPIDTPIFSIHAEMSCLINSRLLSNRKKLYKILKTATMYISGKTPTGTIMLSRPCMICMKMLSNIGLSRIVYDCPEGPREEITWKTTHQNRAIFLSY